MVTAMTAMTAIERTLRRASDSPTETQIDSYVLCDISSGRSLSTMRWEDDTVVAIKPLDEVSPGHTVVLPKCHYRDLFDIPADMLADLMFAAKQVARQLESEFGATGVNVLHASG